MAVLLSIDGSLVTTTKKHPEGKYSPIKIGKPISVQLLTFFPGRNINDWGGKAELMISSHVRIRPTNEPAPRLINMILYNYNFKIAPPVQNYGGDVYGDPMIFYSKAYIGARLGITLRGVEIDKVGPKTWNGITSTISTLGNLALFTAAAPYLAAAGLATKMTKTLIRAINRNDRISTERADFYFDDINKTILQSGRYIFWSGSPSSQTIKNRYELTGAGSDIPNILVEKPSGRRYLESPYFVLQIDGKERKEYAGFEIGSSSAELLEKWGDKDKGSVIFQTIKELACQINDAKQLQDVQTLAKELKRAKTEEKKAAIREKINAHMELFSEDNQDFMKEILENFFK